MSKAFTRESDDSDETFTPPRPPLPPGTQNYITPEGAARIQTELNRLLEAKRNLPPGGQNPASSSDARIQYLQGLVRSFVVVESSPAEAVRFGSTVQVTQNGEEETYRIVGVDEIDLEHNRISWLSPLARALLAGRVGDQIEFQAPSGVQHLRIESIH